MVQQILMGYTEIVRQVTSYRDISDVGSHPPDPWSNYHIARDSRYSGTGAWFIQGDALSEWKASGPSSLLWIYGRRMFLPALTLS